MNEVAAAGLLQAAESQQPDFPGLTRGLVAVVLYYDSQRKLLWALRTLMQVRTHWICFVLKKTDEDIDIGAWKLIR